MMQTRQSVSRYNYQDELNDLLYSLPEISTALPAETPTHLDSTARDTSTEFIYKIDYCSVAAGYDEQIVHAVVHCSRAVVTLL